MATQFVLGTGGQTGRKGPTQSMLQKAYAGTTLEGKITSHEGIQKFTIPVTGDYKLTAIGARGAKGNPGSYTDGGECGGFGASMSGEFHLIENDELYMLVGQKGVDFNGSGPRDGTTGSGGGGSFITKRVLPTEERRALDAWKMLPDNPVWWKSYTKYFYVRKFSDTEYWLVFFDEYYIPKDLKVDSQGRTGIIIKYNGSTECPGLEFSRMHPWTYVGQFNALHDRTEKFNTEYMVTNCKPIYDALHMIGHTQVQLLESFPYSLNTAPIATILFAQGSLPEDIDLPQMELWNNPRKYYLFYKHGENLYGLIHFDSYWIGPEDPPDAQTIQVSLYRNGETRFSSTAVQKVKGQWQLVSHFQNYRFDNLVLSAPNVMMYTNCYALYQRLLKSLAKDTIKLFQPPFVVNVEPLVIAGGGNGGPDRGYSGIKTVYHAQTEIGSNPGQNSNAGGGFLSGATSSSNVGYSFSAGGQGAAQWNNRNGTSEPGFGGGGGSADDGDGAGGGGYYGGARGSYGASSFNVGKNQVNTAQVGIEDGSIIIDLLAVKKYVILDGDSVKAPRRVQEEVIWVEVAKPPITLEILKTYGVAIIPSTIKGLVTNNPKIFAWTDTPSAVPQKAVIKYSRDDAILIMEKDILFTDYNIANLLKLSIDYEVSGDGGMRCLVSVDSGQSWKSFHGEQWITVDINNLNDFWELGTPIETIKTLNAAQLQHLANAKFRFAILGRLTKTTDSITAKSIQMQFAINE